MAAGLLVIVALAGPHRSPAAGVYSVAAAWSSVVLRFVLAVAALACFGLQLTAIRLLAVDVCDWLCSLLRFSLTLSRLSAFPVPAAHQLFDKLPQRPLGVFGAKVLLGSFFLSSHGVSILVFIIVCWPNLRCCLCTPRVQMP